MSGGAGDRFWSSARIALVALSVGAAGLTSTTIAGSFAVYADVKLILEDQRDRLPAALRNPDESKWNTWSRREDKAIHLRLDQGDLDSIVNLLLFGTSFTRQPRIKTENLAEASKAGVLRARIDDLVSGLRNPGDHERLIFLQRVLRTQGMDPQGPEISAELGKFLYRNLQRVAEERRTLAERAARANPSSVLDRASLFSDRGVSLDTSILPNYSLEQTLSDLKQKNVLREGQVTRVAVIGPGLDFIDKNDESAYDYYPPQTVQPFALLDSMLRLRLTNSDAITLSMLDVSARVIDHMLRARDRARKAEGYTIQLPRDVSRPWPPSLSAYWKSLGEQVGASVGPIPPPQMFPGLETRALRIRPEVVLACEPVDLDIVVQRLTLSPAGRFDLIVASNVFLYYSAFEQSLALENVRAMLKPGGLLLTNDRLPESPHGAMREAGVTVVSFDDRDPKAREAMGWYRKQ